MRKNKIKRSKVLIIGALLLAVTLLLAACGNANNQNGTSPSPSATTSEKPQSTPNGSNEDGDNTEDLAPWNGFDFGPNVEYVEEYQIEGDPGEGLRPWEAAKVLVDTALNDIYGTDLPIRIALVGLDVIEAEECYIFEVSAQDDSITPSLFGVGYQGNVYALDDDQNGDEAFAGNDAGDSWSGVYKGDGFSITISEFSGESFWFDITSLRDGRTAIAGTATLYTDNSLMAEYEDISFGLYDDFSGLDFFASESSEWAHLRGQYLRME